MSGTGIKITKMSHTYKPVSVPKTPVAKSSIGGSAKKISSSIIFHKIKKESPKWS